MAVVVSIGGGGPRCCVSGPGSGCGRKGGVVVPRKPKAHSNGRPTKLSDELQAQIVADVRAGSYAEVAAQRAGIGETTFYRWMRWGEAARPRYRQFRQAIRDAEGHAEVRAVTLVATEMSKDWKAAAWYLERKFQARWGRRERVEQAINMSVSEELISRLDRAKVRARASQAQLEPAPFVRAPVKTIP